MKEYEIRLAYLAGFLDGEGCIYGHETRKGVFRLAVKVSNNDKTPLMEFQELFGGSITSFTRNRIHYTWSISGYGAWVLLMSLLPDLKVKQSQARLGIELQSLVGRVGVHISKEARYQRSEIARLLRIEKL